MKYESPAEIEARYADALGTEFGKVYYELENEVVWLHNKWREYRALFGHSEARIELLNRAAAVFFGQLDGILWEDVLLHICRLTDPVAVGGYRQLTIRRLPGYISDPTLRARIEALLDATLSRSEFARDWRNRHIGHRSLARATDSAARPLAHASRASVERVLDALDEVMMAIHESLMDGGIDLRPSGDPGDADDLMHVLDEGVRAREAREERFRTHKPLPEDLAPRRAV